MTIEEAKKILNRMMTIRYALMNCEEKVDADDAIILAIKALEERQKYRLIPVTERLPEEGEYLCFHRYGGFHVCRFTKDAYKLDKNDFYHYKGKKKALFYQYDPEYGYYSVDVRAWMPLPEPYEEVEE